MICAKCLNSLLKASAIPAYYIVLTKMKGIYMRFLLLAGLLVVSACSYFEPHDTVALPADDIAHSLDITVHEEPPVPEGRVRDTGTASALPVGGYYPAMRGYRLNRNVEIFPLD